MKNPHKYHVCKNYPIQRRSTASLLLYHTRVYCIASYCIIVSYHIKAYHIVSYPMLSFGILWYPFLSYYTLSYPIVHKSSVMRLHPQLRFHLCTP